MFPASGDERFDKLPKWARDSVLLLERRYYELNKRIAEYETEATEATLIRLVGYGQPDTTLPDRSTVRFKIGPNYEEYIDVGFEYDDTLASKGKIVGLCVRAGNKIYIEPQAANTFFAKCEMRAPRVKPTGDA